MELYSLLQSFVNYANGQYHLEPLLRQGEKLLISALEMKVVRYKFQRLYRTVERRKRNGANRLCDEEDKTIGEWQCTIANVNERWTYTIFGNVSNDVIN